jgi:hypothetical protein
MRSIGRRFEPPRRGPVRGPLGMVGKLHPPTPPAVIYYPKLPVGRNTIALGVSNRPRHGLRGRWSGKE